MPWGGPFPQHYLVVGPQFTVTGTALIPAPFFMGTTVMVPRVVKFDSALSGFDMEIGGPDGSLATRRMKVGDTLHITPGTRHRLTAVEDTDIFEVSTPEIDDVVRLEDRYGRVPHPPARPGTSP